MLWVVHKFLTGSVDLKRVEAPLKATSSGLPSTSRKEELNAKVKTTVRNNRRLPVREVAHGFGISVGSCDAFLMGDLHMKLVCAKFVSRLLTYDQREYVHGHVRGREGSMASRSSGFGSPGLCSEMSFRSL
jgi:hypothetical protein